MAGIFSSFRLFGSFRKDLWEFLAGRPRPIDNPSAVRIRYEGFGMKAVLFSGEDRGQLVLL